MAVKRPTLDGLEGVAARLSFKPSPEDLQFFHADMQSALDDYDAVDALP